MSKIPSACPDCGRSVVLERGDIILGVRSGAPATYTFACPACGTLTAKRADTAAALLLRRCGVPTVTLAQRYPESRSPGPPLGLDDLLELHELLATDGWLARWGRSS